jgi:hypothetical protein
MLGFRTKLSSRLQFAVRSQTKNAAPSQLKVELADILVCPVSKDYLYYDEKTDSMISTAAKIAYPLTKKGFINLNPYDANRLPDNYEYMKR